MKLLFLILISLVIQGCDQSTNTNTIKESNLHKHIKILASDELKGDYYLEVPLSKMTVNLDSSFLSITKNDQPRILKPGSESVYWTKRVVEGVSVRSSELVFVGYGIVAPEYGWNDYKNLDVKGKTAVMLINDPGFWTDCFDNS